MSVPTNIEECNKFLSDLFEAEQGAEKKLKEFKGQIEEQRVAVNRLKQAFETDKKLVGIKK